MAGRNPEKVREKNDEDSQEQPNQASENSIARGPGGDGPFADPNRIDDEHAVALRRVESLFEKQLVLPQILDLGGFCGDLSTQLNALRETVRRGKALLRVAHRPEPGLLQSRLSQVIAGVRKLRTK